MAAEIERSPATTMKKTFQTILLVLVVQGFLYGQSTWKGLRFGMSEAEVRATYGKALQREVNETQETVLVDDAFELLPAPLSVPASVRLSLGKSGKLEVINIIAKESPFANEKDEASASGSTSAVIDEMTSRLVDRYGKPLTEEGECKLTAEMLMNHTPVVCHAVWRSEGQKIEVAWSVFDGRLKNFVLSYQPVPTDF
jgi:hypothetical protein